MNVKCWLTLLSLSLESTRFTTYIGARKDWCIINPMEFKLKERLSKTNARTIPKAVFGIIGVAISFWFVMFLKQFDQGKKKK